MNSEFEVSHIKGSQIKARYKDFGEEIAINDSKIKFISEYTKQKDVLDLGCVQHNKENYYSRYWLHKALAVEAKNIMGMDLCEEGVKFLKDKGLNVVFGDAQDFSLELEFDVIVAGDLIEHLDNLKGFLQSCKTHLRPNGRLIITTPNPWHWKFIVRSATRGGDVPVNPEHTCWLCPNTLRQLVRRGGMDVAKIVHGSRYKKDLIIPFPKGWKHTSFYAEIFVR